MDALGIVLVACYATLVLELVVFPIPSVASTYQLLQAGHGPSSLPERLLRYALPTAVGVTAFVLPLGAALWPPAVDWLWPVSALWHPAVRWTGIAVVVAGRIVTLVAVIQLRGRANRSLLQPTGLYAHTRNPALLGLHLFYVGNCLAFPSLVLWLLFWPYALNLHHRVRLEERHLEQAIGDDYRAYLRRVPRYFGFAGGTGSSTASPDQ